MNEPSRVAQEAIDLRGRPVTVKTKRGNLRIDPSGRIDGLWQVVKREVRTNAQVRAMCGKSTTRATLLRWRRRETDPFPRPVLLIPGQTGRIELWSRTAVEEWCARQQ